MKVFLLLLVLFLCGCARTYQTLRSTPAEGKTSRVVILRPQFVAVLRPVAVFIDGSFIGNLGARRYLSSYTTSGTHTYEFKLGKSRATSIQANSDAYQPAYLQVRISPVRGFKLKVIPTTDTSLIAKVDAPPSRPE